VRDRREIVTAVVVSGAIALGTLLLIWMMRPATPGDPGSGGIMTRQPRVSLLIILTLGVGAFVIWWISRDRHRRRFSARQLIAFSIVVMLVLASVAAVTWPGGLIRHYPSQQPIDIPVPSSGSSTTTPGQTTAPSAPGTTGAPTTPTTGSP
jgi:hypothetical protein